MNYLNINEILIYLRKSRKDYEFINESIEKTLERHEKILQEYAVKTFGVPIPEENIFREVVSGDTIADRPEIQKVLSLIESNKYKAVLTLEIERLARGNTIDQGIIAQTFEFTDTLIITPQKIFNLHDELDRSFFEDGLYQSRKYLLYTKKILARGREQSSKEGKFVGSVTPFGYNKIKLENEKGYKLVINNEEAEIVRLIFKMYLDGTGTQNIANKLNEIGAKARKKSYWNATMVRNILSKKTINGKITWNRRKITQSMENGEIIKKRPIQEKCIIINGLHEAIIDDDTWNKAHEIMRKRKREKPPTEIKNPFAALIYCKKCGEKMVRRPYQNGRISSIICKNNTCDNISSDLNYIEKKVLEKLKEILKEIENTYIDNVNIKKTDYNAIKNNINIEIKNAKERLKNVYEFFENGIYNKEEFQNRKDDINNEIKTHEIALKNIEIEEKNDKRDKYISAIPKIKNALSIYDKLSPNEKNELLKAFISKIYYLKEKKGRWDSTALTDFTIEIELKI